MGLTRQNFAKILYGKPEEQSHEDASRIWLRNDWLVLLLLFIIGLTVLIINFIFHGAHCNSFCEKAQEPYMTNIENGTLTKTGNSAIRYVQQPY